MFNAKQSLYRKRHRRWRRYVVTDRYDGGALEGKTYNLAIDNKGEGGLTAILDHYDYLYMSIDCCFVFPMPESLFSLGFSQLSNGRIPSCGGYLIWKSVVVSMLHTVCVCNCKACWTRFKERKRWCMSGLEHWRGQPLQSSQQIVGRWIRNRSFFSTCVLAQCSYIWFHYFLFSSFSSFEKEKETLNRVTRWRGGMVSDSLLR